MNERRPVVYNMHQAKTHLSRLVECAGLGEDVFIAKDGEPVVRLVPVDRSRRRRPAGLYAGTITIREDFDDPLPDDLTGLPPEGVAPAGRTGSRGSPGKGSARVTRRRAPRG